MKWDLWEWQSTVPGVPGDNWSTGILRNFSRYSERRARAIRGSLFRRGQWILRWIFEYDRFLLTMQANMLASLSDNV